MLPLCLQPWGAMWKSLIISSARANCQRMRFAPSSLLVNALHAVSLHFAPIEVIMLYQALQCTVHPSHSYMYLL